MVFVIILRMVLLQYLICSIDGMNYGNWFGNWFGYAETENNPVSRHQEEELYSFLPFGHSYSFNVPSMPELEAVDTVDMDSSEPSSKFTTTIAPSIFVEFSKTTSPPVPFADDLRLYSHSYSLNVPSIETDLDAVDMDSSAPPSELPTPHPRYR